MFITLSLIYRSNDGISRVMSVIVIKTAAITSRELISVTYHITYTPHNRNNNLTLLITFTKDQSSRHIVFLWQVTSLVKRQRAMNLGSIILTVNPLTAKLFNLTFHPLEVVSR